MTLQGDFNVQYPELLRCPTFGCLCCWLFRFFLVQVASQELNRPGVEEKRCQIDHEAFSTETICPHLLAYIGLQGSLQ